MPIASRRPCAYSGGCSELTANRYCQKHTVTRATPARRGYDSAWRRYSLARLRHHPWCADPYGVHQARVAASCTDHITPHHGDWKLFWERRNHQSLCDGCHSRKTATEDGGFGNQTG